MILSDLDCIRVSYEKKKIIGSACCNVYADTTAITSPGTAHADSIAISPGDYTTAFSDTLTKVYQFDELSSVSFASANAKASALSDTSRFVADSTSVSTYIYGVT